MIWGKVLHGRAEGAAACGNLAYLCDPALRDQVRARGDDLIELEIAAAGIATPFWEVKEHHREDDEDSGALSALRGRIQR